MSKSGVPVHADVEVHAYNTIYRTDDWWKAAVTHSYGSGDPGVAVYLWHKDEEWTQKNKYNVKTQEAWQSDKHLIEQYLAQEGQEVSSQDQFPVSDYYNVAQGETVFQTDEWWKAIILIDTKGSYETEEVIIYLWQEVDGDWRRRQKYAIKNLDDWADDRDAVDELLGEEETTEPTRIHSVDRIAAESESASKTASDPATTETTADDSETILDDLQSEFKELHIGSDA